MREERRKEESEGKEDVHLTSCFVFMIFIF